MSAADYIAEVTARADAATDGPWDYEDCEGEIQVNAGTARTEWNGNLGTPASSWRVGDRILEYEVESWDEGESAQDDQMRRNAEFAAAAREDVPRMTAALRAVLELHKPVTVQVVTGDCSIEECGHEDECPTVPFDICAACHELVDRVDTYYSERGVGIVAHPCDTRRAITEKLGADDA